MMHFNVLVNLWEILYNPVLFLLTPNLIKITPLTFSPLLYMSRGGRSRETPLWVTCEWQCAMNMINTVMTFIGQSDCS